MKSVIEHLNHYYRHISRTNRRHLTPLVVYNTENFPAGLALPPQIGENATD